MDKKEIARDIIAFGSIPFYAIVIARATVGEHLPFVAHLLLAALLLFLASLFVSFNRHMARGVILAIFTSAFYQDGLFTAFAFALTAMMLMSLRYLKTRTSDLARSVLAGVVVSGISYAMTALLVY